jgi:uncharacterized protein (DUF305 family)
MSKSLGISLIIVALILGIGIGYVLTPEYSMAEESMEEDLGKADKFVDQRYLDMMIAHHESAMDLARQAKDKTKRKQIKDLATMILKSEPGAIDELYEWKKDWYNDRKKVELEEKINLGSFDEKFDLRFLNALIAHHENGIEMAEEIKFKSSRNEVLNNSDEVKEFLESSKKTLEQMRSEWYQ